MFNIFTLHLLIEFGAVSMADNSDKILNQSGQITNPSSSNFDILHRLGLEKNCWYETIITTNGPHINAAAVGIQWTDSGLHMKIFELSNTYDNLQNGQAGKGPRKFCINIIDSSQIDMLCYAALRGWGSPIPEFPAEYFEMVNDTPVLKDARACIICEPAKSQIEEVKDSFGKSSRMDMIASIIDVVQMEKGDFKPIVRGPAEPLVDALVYATKFKIAKGSMKDKCRSKVEELLEQAGRPEDVAHTLTMEALKEYFGIFD